MPARTETVLKPQQGERVQTRPAIRLFEGPSLPTFGYAHLAPEGKRHVTAPVVRDIILETGVASALRPRHVVGDASSLIAGEPIGIHHHASLLEVKRLESHVEETGQPNSQRGDQQISGRADAAEMLTWHQIGTMPGFELLDRGGQIKLLTDSGRAARRVVQGVLREDTGLPVEPSSEAHIPTVVHDPDGLEAYYTVTGDERPDGMIGPNVVARVERSITGANLKSSTDYSDANGSIEVYHGAPAPEARSHGIITLAYWSPKEIEEAF